MELALRETQSQALCMRDLRQASGQGLSHCGAGYMWPGRMGAASPTSSILWRIHKNSIEVNAGSRTCLLASLPSPSSAFLAVMWQVSTPSARRLHSTFCWALPDTPPLLSLCHCLVGTDRQKQKAYIWVVALDGDVMMTQDGGRVVVWSGATLHGSKRGVSRQRTCSSSGLTVGLAVSTA